MATANLTWNAPPGGATGYKVEYKKAVDGTWILFSPNVPATSCQITGLEIGTVYDFRITSKCPIGDAGGVIQTGTIPCPPTTVQQAYLIQDASVNVNQNNWTASARPHIDYGMLGTRIYAVNGWTSTGFASAATLDNTIASNTFWNNFFQNTSHGRMNNVCLWARAACNSGSWHSTLSEWIGFVRTISVPSTKLYYIGLGADNRARVTVNGPGFNNVTILQHNNEDVQHFQYWHIIPIQLTAGTYTIRMEGYDTGITGAFGFEIYDNTESQLYNATSETDLRIIYSTKNEFCSRFDTGTSVGYSCPAGWTLENSDSSPKCVKLNEVCATPPQA